MSDKILQMFFDIGRWKKAIEKGVLKDIRKDQLIRLTDEHTRMAMADAMIQGKYEIAPPHTAQIPKENGEFRTVPTTCSLNSCRKWYTPRVSPTKAVSAVAA